MPGSLTIVGTGIEAAAHASIEGLRHIRKADKLFHLVGDGATESWLESLNPTAESLTDCYGEGKPLEDTYAEATERILAPLARGLEVCAAFYGHPGVFCTPSRRAIRLARERGHDARMLPGISSLDCLLCDLAVDPGIDGCQVFEATSLLIRGLIFDPSVHLVLLQVGLLGGTAYDSSELWNRAGLEVLATRLAEVYPLEHQVVVYEAPPFPASDTVVIEVPLKGLAKADVTARSTLYVPPLPRRSVDSAMLEALGMPPDFGSLQS